MNRKLNQKQKLESNTAASAAAVGQVYRCSAETRCSHRPRSFRWVAIVKLRVRFGLVSAVLDETTTGTHLFSLQAITAHSTQHSSSNSSSSIWHSQSRFTKMSPTVTPVQGAEPWHRVAPSHSRATPALNMSAPTLRFVRMLASVGCGVLFSVQSSVACLAASQLQELYFDLNVRQRTGECAPLLHSSIVDDESRACPSRPHHQSSPT